MLTIVFSERVVSGRLLQGRGREFATERERLRGTLAAVSPGRLLWVRGRVYGQAASEKGVKGCVFVPVLRMMVGTGHDLEGNR